MSKKKRRLQSGMSFRINAKHFFFLSLSLSPSPRQYAMSTETSNYPSTREKQAEVNINRLHHSRCNRRGSNTSLISAHAHACSRALSPFNTKGTFIGMMIIIIITNARLALRCCTDVNEVYCAARSPNRFSIQQTCQYASNSITLCNYPGPSSSTDHTRHLPTEPRVT